MATISSLGIGSGLDLNGLLDQLRAAERQKLQPIVNQQNQEKARVSAYGQLQTTLNAFKDAVATLNDSAFYSSVTTNVLGEGVSATSNDKAVAGRYEVSVTQTAKTGSLATQRVAAPDAAIVGDTEQTLELTFADTGLPTVDVTIAANSTLEDIRDAINAHDGAGVSASIVNDGSGYRLALNSTESGADAAITGTNFYAILNQETKDAINADNVEAPDSNQVVVQQGQDAALEINGIAITSTSNTVEGAIQGVTLQLDAGAVDQTATVVVEQDSAALKEAVQAFVTAYNDIKTTAGKLTNVTGDAATAGDLVGDRTVRNIESRLSRDLIEPMADGELTMLSQFGIQLNQDGELELDEGKLDDVIAGNPQALADFFAGASEEAGMAGRLEGTLSGFLDSENGSIVRAIEGSEARGSRLDDRYLRTEQSIERTISRYRSQFSQLDGMIAQMNSLSAYLGQQFDMMNAQMNQK